jgi:peptidoglycan/LPS O-acetylase OafA/YrhL
MSNIKREPLPALTSLRFFAAACIVALHIGQALPFANIYPYIRASQAVSFFFVLSGFILAYSYPTLPTPQSRKRFLMARFARIWPVHMVTLGIWIVVILGASWDAITWRDGIARLVATVAMVQSWVPVTIWPTSYNGVSWSISLEVFFYLLFPILIVRLARNWKAVLLVTISLTALSLFLTTLVPADDSGTITLSGLYYFSPLARLHEFVAGVGMMLLLRKLPISRDTLSPAGWTALETASVCLALGSMVLLRPHTFTTSPFVVQVYLAVSGSFPAFAVLIGVFSYGAGYLSKALAWRPLVFLGEISFALYMVHYTVVAYIANHAQLRSGGWVTYIAAWALSLSVATALFLAVEAPARRWLLQRYDRRQRVGHHATDKRPSGGSENAPSA